MKHLFKRTSDVAHSWAHQLQDSAHCGRLFFEGDTIYSYSHHYPISRIVYNSRGEKAYILNSQWRSIETYKHQTLVRGAIPHGAIVFYTQSCLTPEFKNGKNIYFDNAITVVAHNISEIIELMGKQRRAKTNDYRSEIIGCCKFIRSWIAFWGLDKRQNWLTKPYLDTTSKRPSVFEYFTQPSRFNRIKYAGIFGCGEADVESVFTCFSLYNKVGFFSLELPDAYSVIDNLIAEYFKIENKEAIEARNAKILVNHKRWLRNAEKTELRRSVEKLERWHGGKEYCWYPSPNFFDAYGWDTGLRLINDKQTIETSKGIFIDVEEGARLWSIVKTFEDGMRFRHDLALDISGTKWKIDKYQKHILFAGCHAIPFSECQMIANQLGWN